MNLETSQYPRGVRDLNPARKVGFFFPATVDGLTNYVIRHHFLIGKCDIIAMPPSPRRCTGVANPFSGAPGRVPHKLDGTRILKLKL